jgi:hypothetical protein
MHTETNGQKDKLWDKRLEAFMGNKDFIKAYRVRFYTERAKMKQN